MNRRREEINALAGPRKLRSDRACENLAGESATQPDHGTFIDRSMNVKRKSCTQEIDCISERSHLDNPPPPRYKIRLKMETGENGAQKNFSRVTTVRGGVASQSSTYFAEAVE